MAWRVKMLLEHAEEIRALAEGDDYLDLLSVERAIYSLRRRGLLTRLEMRIISLVRRGFSIRDIARIVKKSRGTISKIYRSLSDRIAFVLGDDFTDEGYFQALREKYRLSPEDLEKLIRRLT